MIRLVHFADRLAFLEGDAEALAGMDLSGYRIPQGVNLPQLIEQTERDMAEMAAQLGINTSNSTSHKALDGGLGGTGGQPVRAMRAAGAGRGDQELAEHVRDLVLVGNAFDESGLVSAGSDVIEQVVRALRVVFDLQAVFCFRPTAEDGDRYIGQALGNTRSRSFDLEFVRGQSPSEIARAAEHGVVLLAGDVATPPTVLDDQLMRMSGNAGVVYIPLRDGAVCRCVLVAGVDARQQAELREARLLCLEHFVAVAGRLLSRNERVTPSPQPPERSEPSGRDDDRVRLQRMVHEIGNPLAVIHNYLALLEHKFVEKDIDRRELSIVTQEIARLTRILAATADDQDGSDERPENVSLNALIEDMVELCRPKGAESDAPIEIRTALHPDLAGVSGRGDRLRQLILNLLKNALEALAGKGGLITVSTRPWANIRGPQFTEICIEDTGPGLPPAVLDRLFQPVVSDKGGLHQGIGLVIVGQLVRELDGLINCRSTDQGTCFQILLPHSP